MGLWHGVEYYEKEKIVGEEYYQQWNNVSDIFYCFIQNYIEDNKKSLHKFKIDNPHQMNEKNLKKYKYFLKFYFFF